MTIQNKKFGFITIIALVIIIIIWVAFLLTNRSLLLMAIWLLFPIVMFPVVIIMFIFIALELKKEKNKEYTYLLVLNFISLVLILIQIYFLFGLITGSWGFT